MTISTQRLRFLRGNTAAASAFTGLGGELIVDTTLNTIRVQDGYTPGGTLLATAAQLSNVSIDQLTNGIYTLQLDTNGDAVIPGNLVSANTALTSYMDLHKNGLGGVEVGAYTDFTVLTSLAGANNQWVFETDGNLTIAGNINYANGVSILNGITANGGGNYSNVNVAAYLPTYTGNVNAAYFTGNGALLTGISASSNYGNANVASYLPTYTGNISASIITATESAELGSLNFFASSITMADDTWDNIFISPNGESYAYLQVPKDSVANVQNVRLHNDIGNVEIGTNSGSSLWYFDNSGKLTIPGEIQGKQATVGGYANLRGGYGTAGPGGDVLIAGGASGNGISEFGNVVIAAGSGQWTFDNTGNLAIPPNGWVNVNSGGIKNTLNEDFYIRGSDDEQDGWSIYNVIDDGAGNQLTKTQLQYNRFSVYTDVSGNNYSFDFREGGEFDVPKSIRGPYGGNLVISIGDQPSSDTYIDLQTRSYVGDALISNVRIANPNITISTASSAYNWTFDSGGDLTLPDIPDVGGRINAANNIKLRSGSSTWDFAPNGVLTSLGNIIAPNFIGNVTGNVGTFNTVYGTLGTAAQPSITSLGTLTGLAVGGTVNTTTLQVDGNATIGNLLVTGTSTIIGNINMISGNSGQFFGNSPTGFNALYTGIAAGYTPLNQTIIQSSGNYNDYVQVNLENVNSGNAATGDYVVTADNGTDSTYYIDMGIASSNFDGLSPNIVGNSVRANDAYLYTMGNGAGNQGGNLIIGAGTASKVVKIIAGGGHDHDVIAQVSSSLFTVFGSTTANGNVTTGSYFIGNGSQLTGVQAVSATSATYVTGLTSANVTTALGYTPTTYANANVAAYLPTYTGNISFGNLTLSSNSSNIVFTNGATIYGDTGGLNRNGSIVLQPAASGTFPSVVIGGAGRLAAPNGSVHQILNANDVTFQVAVKNITGLAATSTTTGALQITGGAGISGNVYAGGNVVVTGNVTGTYFVGNGSLLTGLTASSNYGNTNVAGYLGAYGSNTIVTTGNITAGYFVGNGALLTGIVASGSTYANSNVAAYLASNSAVPITTTSNVTASYFVGNGSLLSGIVANTSYNNSNVASYLAGNIVVGNISGNDPNVTLVANTYSYVFSNIGNVSFPGNLTVVSNVSVGNIFATGYYYANGTAFTGTGSSSNYGNANVAAYLLDNPPPGTYSNTNVAAYLVANPQSGTYSNTNVASYLPTYTGNVNAAYFTGNGSTLTNITAANVSGTVANATYATSAASATTATSATYVTGLTSANVTTALGYTPTSYSDSNVSSYLSSGSTNTINALSATLRNGDANPNYASTQITFGYNNTTQYPHFIHTRHNAGSGLYNSIELYTSDGTAAGVFPTNGILGLSVNNGKVGVGNNANPTYTLDVAGNAYVSGNLTAAYFVGNGALLTGISTSSSYGNSNVVTLLGSLGSNAISTTGNVTASYFVGNGALLTGITATSNYNDANVATFLANIGSNAITTTGNVTASYFVGNGALLTGIVASGSTYSNTNVAAFLSNVGSNAIVTTGNVTASYFVGNGALLTGMYSNANVISMLAANDNLTIGNVGTTYSTASNITTVFVGNSTTIVNGGSGSGQTNLLNNLYYDATNTQRYRNTQTGAAQLTMGGSGGFSFAGTTSGVTANAASGMGIWATLTGSTLQTYNSIGITSSGALTTTSGSLVTGAAVSTVFNTIASTVNMGGAATTIAMGASTGTVTIGSGNGNITVGNISAGGNITANNVIGLTTNTTITAGTYVSSFLSNGLVSMTGLLNITSANTVANTDSQVVLSGNVSKGGSGYHDFLRITSTFSGVTNPTKWLRLNSTGGLELLDSAYANQLVSITDGGDVTIKGNVTINGVNPGYGPNRPALRVYGNTSTNFTAGTTISNQVVDYNQGSYYTNSTGLFTAPIAGLYHCYATIRVGNNNALNQAALLKNGTLSGANVIAFWETDTNAGVSSHFSITGYAKCVAGDTLSLKVIAGNVQFDTNDSWGVTYIG